MFDPWVISGAVAAAAYVLLNSGPSLSSLQALAGRLLRRLRPPEPTADLDRVFAYGEVPPVVVAEWLSAVERACPDAPADAVLHWLRKRLTLGQILTNDRDRYQRMVHDLSAGEPS